MFVVPSHTQRTSHQFWVLPVLAVSTNVVINRIYALSSSIGGRKEKKNVYMITQAPSPILARLKWAHPAPRPYRLLRLAVGPLCPSSVVVRPGIHRPGAILKSSPFPARIRTVVRECFLVVGCIIVS